MAKLIWDETGKHFYETGVDHGVLYIKDDAGASKGVVWDSLTAVTQSPDGAEETPIYADNIKYLGLLSAENFKGTIAAIYSPVEFDACDGSAEIAKGVTIGQQTRKPFGFSYRTLKGNDEEASDYGYKIHIVYNAKASPSERAYNTINETPATVQLSWSFTTTPVKFEGFKPSAHVVIDSNLVTEAQLKAIEDLLYGTEEAEPKLPTPEELVAIFAPVEP